MRTTRRDVLLGSSALLATGAGVRPALAATGPAEAQAQALIDRTAEALLVLNPAGATGLGIDKDARAALKHKLGDRTPAGVAKMAAHLKATLAEIERIDVNAVSPEMRVHLDVIQTAYANGLKGIAFPYGDVAVGSWRNTPYVVIQNVGAYIDVPKMLDSDHQIATRDDADAYCDRLQAYAGALDGETVRLQQAASVGVIAPDFLLDKCLKQIHLARSGDPATWDVVSSLAKRTTAIAGGHAARAAKIAAEQIAPALDRQIAELEKQRTRATSDAGVWKFKDGDAYYAWALSAGTTTTMSPDEVHAMGKAQLAELQAEMDTILKTLGYTQGSVGARMRGLATDKRFAFPENDAGRAEIIQILQKSIDDMRTRMPQAFHTLVPGNVEVKRIAPVEEAGAAGAYGGPGTIDGKVPGRLWINLRSTGIWTRFSLPDLAYHEAIPGHAWQGEYTFKMPLIRSLLQFNAYSEGWALYAEQLGDELGVYAENPAAKLGYLQSLGFRACRLVVDSGLHAKRWTREQAIRWFVEANGSSEDEVQGEVDRYCSWPGQACGYKVGHTAINRLRTQAKTALGDRFDFRAFNDALALGGNVPMTVLGHVIDRHIAQRKG